MAKLAHTRTGDTLGDKTQPLAIPPFVYPQPLYAVDSLPGAAALLAQLPSATAPVNPRR